MYYRQIKVGEISGYGLSSTSDNVRIDVEIFHPYTPLVRKHSQFFHVGGVDVALNLTGIDVQTESLAALVTGGIAFATPDNDKMGEQATAEDTFRLYDHPKSKWLKWQPAITLDLEK